MNPLRQKCPGLKEPESIDKRPLEEITSETETLSNDQPIAKRQKLQQTSFSSLPFQQTVVCGSR